MGNPWGVQRMTSRRHLALIGMCLLLIATTADANTPAAPLPEEDETPLDRRVVTLDPAQIHAQVQAGKAFTLPSLYGDVTFENYQNVLKEPSEIYRLDEHGSYVFEGYHASNVWEAASRDGSVTAIVLALPDRLSATLVGPQGRSSIEPLFEGPDAPMPARQYTVYGQVENVVPPVTLTGTQMDGVMPDDDGVNTLSGIGISATTTLTMAAYADAQFVNQYGGTTWPDQIDYILAWQNGYTDDYEIVYAALTKIYAGTIANNNDPTSKAWNFITSASTQGRNVKMLFSYVDYDGNFFGGASCGGISSWLQHKPDAAHAYHVPDNNFERAYFTAHELAHNSQMGHSGNAGNFCDCSSCPWSNLVCCPHTHRSIGYHSGNYHLHECWSQTNLNRMASFQGKSVVGTAC